MLVIVMLAIFMDAYPLFVDRQISKPGINPPAGVVIVDAVFLHVDGLVRMPAENALRAVMMRVGQSAARHFRRHAQPSRIQPVNQPRHRLALEVKFLQQQIE
jgi:hypothetical protein